MGATSTITSKGQITLPSEVRDRLGVRAGDKVEFFFDGNQTIVKPVRQWRADREKWVGIAKGRFKSDDELLAYEREIRGLDDWDLRDRGL